MATKKKTTAKVSKRKVPTKSTVTAPKKTSTRKPGKAKTAQAKTATKSKASAKTVSAEERYLMIQQAAYYLAEKQGFHGNDVANWIQAEKEVDALIASSQV